MGRSKRMKVGRILIILGVLAVSAGLPLKPVPTHAALAPAVELWLSQEYLEGSPGVGQKGSLFAQLQLTILVQGNLVFHDSLDKLERLSMTDALGRAGPGERVVIEFIVELSGAESGNEFQGSSLKTRFSLCLSWEEQGQVVFPGRTLLFNLKNLNPGDICRESLSITLAKKILPPPPPPPPQKK